MSKRFLNTFNQKKAPIEGLLVNSSHLQLQTIAGYKRYHCLRREFQPLPADEGNYQGQDFYNNQHILQTPG